MIARKKASGTQAIDSHAKYASIYYMIKLNYFSYGFYKDISENVNMISEILIQSHFRIVFLLAVTTLCVLRRAIFTRSVK